MNNIVNEIKALDAYVNAMKKIETKESTIQDLDNLLLHINNLKLWAGIPAVETNNLTSEYNSCCTVKNALAYAYKKSQENPLLEKIFKQKITKILYQNSHDDTECLRIKFEDIDKVIDLITKEVDCS